MRKLYFPAALALLFAPVQHAFAQQAKYCESNLVANSFYSNVLPVPGGATVEYHGQFQNQDPKRRTMTATPLRMSKVGTFSVLRQIATFDLAAYQQKDILLFAVQTTNASGSGAPSPATVGSQLRFVCTYR